MLQEAGNVNKVAEDKPTIGKTSRECPLSNTICTPTEGNVVNDFHNIHGVEAPDLGYMKEPPPNPQTK